MKLINEIMLAQMKNVYGFTLISSPSYQWLDTNVKKDMLIMFEDDITTGHLANKFEKNIT